ncbi:MAG: HPr family phosphocarrier protein [Desulfobacula sp.]
MKDSITITRTTSVKNELGMHARPASRIAQIAESAQWGIWLHANSIKVDATSILDILSLCATKGTDIVVEIENKNDMHVLDQIADFFEIGFGESQG